MIRGYSLKNDMHTTISDGIYGNDMNNLFQRNYYSKINSLRSGMTTGSLTISLTRI